VSDNDRLAPLALFLACSLSFAVLLSTLSTSVHTGDSGELLVSAWSLGIPHNPGYPVYSLLGRLAEFLGLGNAAFRVNLLSALCTVLASAFLFITVYHLLRHLVAATMAALLLSISATVWWQATDAEVYTLYLLSLSVLGYTLTRFLTGNDVRWLYCASFIFGLSLGNHVSLVMMVPAIVCLLWGNKSIRDAKIAFVALALIILGLSCYIYLPIRASTSPSINWSHPDTLAGVIYHVGAAEHRGKAMFTEGYQAPLDRFASIAQLLTTQYGPASAIFIAIALWGLWSIRRKRRLVAAATLAVGFNVIYIQFVNVVPLQATGFGYPSYLALVLLFVAGLVRFMQKLPRLAVTMSFLVVLCGIFANYHANDRSEDLLEYQYARNLLSPLPHHAALFAKGDNQIFGLLYLQSVEGVRPDVSLYDAYGEIAVPLKSFAGFRTAEGLPRIEEVCRSFRTCIFGFAPDDELGARAKELTPVGVLQVLGDSSWLSDAVCWALYSLDGVDDERIFKRILSQEIAASYHFHLAKHYLECGDKGRWREELLETSRAGRQVDFIRAQVGDQYAEAGMIDDAIREFAAARRLDPSDADYSNQLGVLFRRSGQNEKAIEAFSAALAAKPRESVYAYNLGNALSAVGRIDQAILNYKLALKSASNPAEVLNNLGQAYRRKGDSEQAIEAFKKAIRAKPDYLAPRLNLGVTFAAMGQYERAIAEYKAALAIDPHSKELHNNLGTAYKRSGEISRAIEQFRKAAKIDPNFLAARVNLGSTFAQMRRYELAIPQYEAALRIDPNYASAYFDLGAIYLQKREIGPCKKMWRKFLKLEPSGPRARRVREVLSTLPP